MKNFFSNCLKLLGLFLLICLSALIFNSFLINHFYNGYKINKEQNILILGDSHTEHAIDDNIFTTSLNLSHSADSYFYSYLKLRKIKKENPQIDKVLLGLSNHNLFIEYEDRWLFNTSRIKSKLRIYMDLMNFSEFLFLFKSNPSGVIQGFIESPKYSIKLIIKGGALKERDLGRFQSSQRNSLKEAINRIKKSKKQRVLEYSKIETEYLFKIVDFCNKNNIELIFVSTPLHPEYTKRKENEFQLLDEFYSSSLSQFKFFNCSKFDLSDGYFQDLDHLNDKGAKLFTSYLMKKLDDN
ncbi:hypothetical protein [Algibacter mikhailovii]|uniref:Uncharacterized protein n=1 Tax=Algibacter mikhailovii TaxID=425498 RepID=A0A918QS33_9FLAO|nr:hypothetical protein [Algibacter mikhailovii]GGZ70371.1 hypothetical protein GCM10007028_04350 [Algibacter mikhailovii]